MCNSTSEEGLQLPVQIAGLILRHTGPIRNSSRCLQSRMTEVAASASSPLSEEDGPSQEVVQEALEVSREAALGSDASASKRPANPRLLRGRWLRKA